MLLVAGVDLAAGRRTGVAIVGVINGRPFLLESHILGFEEAAWLLRCYGVRVAAVDAPLSHASIGAWRVIDLAGRRLGLRLLPPGWRGMRRLVEAARVLMRVALDGGVSIIETHPSSVVKVSGCGDARSLLERCYAGMLDEPRGRDEVDAAVAGCVAYCFLYGCYARVEAVDGSIWLVDPRVCRYPPTTSPRDSPG